MLFPLGTDRPLRSRTVITYALIVLNMGLFGVQQSLVAAGAGDISERIIETMVLWRLDFKWWTLFSYAFLHAGWMHLLGNMLFLYVFGPNIEDRLGKIGFLVFYLVGAAASGGLHIMFSNSPVVGASGAIAACTGAYLVMFPQTLIRAFSLLLVVGIVHVPAWWMIAFAIFWDFVGLSGVRRENVAFLAHLGGYGFGAAVAFMLLWLKLLPREPYDLFTMASQAKRRSEIRAAAGSASKSAQKRAAAAKVDPEVDALAAARAQTVAMIRAGDWPGAGKAYRALADSFAHRPGSAVLTRAHQYELAVRLYSAGDTAAAAYALEQFIVGYPRDSEIGQMRLLLGLLHARSLNDPVRAKALITQAIPDLRDESWLGLARSELAALG